MEVDVSNVHEGHHYTALQHLQSPDKFVVSDHDCVPPFGRPNMTDGAAVVPVTIVAAAAS